MKQKRRNNLSTLHKCLSIRSHSKLSLLRGDESHPRRRSSLSSLVSPDIKLSASTRWFWQHQAPVNLTFRILFREKHGKDKAEYSEWKERQGKTEAVYRTKWQFSTSEHKGGPFPECEAEIQDTDLLGWAGCRQERKEHCPHRTPQHTSCEVLNTFGGSKASSEHLWAWAMPLVSSAFFQSIDQPTLISVSLPAPPLKAVVPIRQELFLIQLCVASTHRVLQKIGKNT